MSHASRIEEALAAGRASQSLVIASWARSAFKHKLSPTARTPAPRCTDLELARLRQSHEPLLRAASGTVQRLLAAVGGVGACVILASEDGVPIERAGHPAEDRDFAAVGLWIGTLWSESEVGTNGIGTCLAEARPVVIDRDQHFLAVNIDLTCASAPVFDAGGRLVGALDVSVARAQGKAGLAGLLSHTVVEAARRIEEELFHAYFPNARMILVPATRTASAGLLAVDEDDLVIGATRSACQGLGLSVQSLPVPLCDLFGQSDARRPEEGERAVIARALVRSGGNVSQAARALGISRATLHRKLNRFDLAH